jgi:exonuclease III
LYKYGDASNHIIYTNIQSLLKNKSELINVITEIKPAIVCLSETRITNDITDKEIEIQGYSLALCESHSRHTGGCVIYVRNDIKFEIFENKNLNLKCWILGIKIKTSKGIFNVICLYRSPSSPQNTFLSAFDEWLENNVLNGQNFIIVGDFNIDIKKLSPVSQNLKEIIQSFGMKQHVKQFTRISKDSKTLIDLVISNQKNVTISMDNKLKISDHELININCKMFNVSLPREENDKIITIKQFKKINFSDVNNYLQQLDWEGKDINEISDKFIKNIITGIEKFVPTISCRESKLTVNEPWFDDFVKSARIRRNLAFHKAGITNKEEDWTLYRILRNVYTNILNDTKCKYYENKIDEVKNNSSEMWKTLKFIINKDKPKLKNVELNINDEEKKNVEQYMNKFYVNSVIDIVNSIPNVTQEDRDKLRNIELNTLNNEKFEFKEIDIIKLKKVLCSLNKNKCSSDIITADSLLKTFDVSGEKLLKIINGAIKNCEFPDCWKISTVIPIPKIKTPKEPQDLRPVNLLPIYEKILEIVLFEQLLDFVESNNILCENQSGFRKKFSCESSIQLVLSKWRSDGNDGNITIAVMLDFKRAFETIDRSILIQKLNKYGLGENSVRLIESYLENRKQKTRFMDKISDEILNELGVPQGSVMGPLLFILYINDLNLQLDDVFVNFFADDTLISASAKTYSEACEKINKSLDMLNIWIKVNKVKLNVSKSKCILITTSSYVKNKINNDSEKINVCIDGEVLEFVDEIKYLGIVIDSHLNFKSHISYIIKKIGSKINYLSRVGQFLSLWTKILIYKTIISPHFDYCSSILFDMNEENFKKLQKLQNRAMRVILQCHRLTPIIEMLNTLCWLSVKQRNAFHVLILVHKIVNKKCPEYLCNDLKFNKDVHSYNTRNAMDINIGKQNNVFFQRSLMVNGFKLFNSLAKDVRNLVDEKMFRRECITFVKKMYVKRTYLK